MTASTHPSLSKTWDGGLRRHLQTLLKPRRIVPTNDSGARPLLGVITIMCFFAALAGESVLLINRAVDEWTAGLSSAVTIQLRPVAGNTDPSLDQQMEQILTRVRTMPGVIQVRPLTRRATEKLLEPWLGAGNLLDELPIPRMIDVTIDTAHPPDMAALARDLGKISPGATLNDHSKWNDQILIFANFLSGLAVGILTLTIAATAIIVIFATRAGLTARHDTVELLHLIGAHDSFIAREFEIQFLMMGLRAGALAIIAAVMTLLLLQFLILQFINVETYFLPAPDLHFSDLIFLLAIPLGAALVASLTTRFTVLRVIGRIL